MSCALGTLNRLMNDKMVYLGTLLGGVHYVDAGYDVVV